MKSWLALEPRCWLVVRGLDDMVGICIMEKALGAARFDIGIRQYMRSRWRRNVPENNSKVDLMWLAFLCNITSNCLNNVKEISFRSGQYINS